MGALFALLSGIVGVFAAIGAAGNHQPWAWKLITAMLGILAGLAIMRWPGATAAVILYLIAFWLILGGIVGIVEFFAAHRSFSRAWLLLLSSVVVILFGIAMFAWPTVTLTLIISLIGLYAIVQGIVLCALAFQVRSSPERLLADTDSSHCKRSLRCDKGKAVQHGPHLPVSLCRLRQGLTYGGKRRLQNIQPASHLILGSHQGHQETDDIVVETGLDENQTAPTRPHQYLRRFGGGWSPVSAVADQLHRHHRSQSANVSNQRVCLLPSPHALPCHVAQGKRTRHQPLALVDIQNRQGSGACHRVAAIRSSQPARLGCIHNFGASHHRGQWQPTCQRLGDEDQIRLQSIVLAGKHPAGAAKSRLYLIGNEKYAVLAADAAELGQEIGRRHHEPTLSLHRLDNNRGHVLRCNARDEEPCQRLLPVAGAGLVQ